MAQDIGFSVRRQGFDSPRGYWCTRARLKNLVTLSNYGVFFFCTLPYRLFPPLTAAYSAALLNRRTHLLPKRLSRSLEEILGHLMVVPVGDCFAVPKPCFADMRGKNIRQSWADADTGGGTGPLFLPVRVTPDREAYSWWSRLVGKVQIAFSLCRNSENLSPYFVLPQDLATNGRTRIRTSDLVLIRDANVSVTSYPVITYKSHLPHQMVQNTPERCNERCKQSYHATGHKSPPYASLPPVKRIRRAYLQQGFLSPRLTTIWPQRGQIQPSKPLPEVLSLPQLLRPGGRRCRPGRAPAYMRFSHLSARLPNTLVFILLLFT